MFLKEIKNIKNHQELYCTMPQLTYEEYFTQYMNALRFLINRSDRNSLKKRFTSAMYIFRHTIELYLKLRLTEQNNTHSIIRLYKASIRNSHPDFLNKLQCVNIGNNGSCFKYVTDNNMVKYFKSTDVFYTLPAFTYFFSLMNEEVENVTKKRDKACFEFRPGAYTTIGHIQGDYGYSIEELLNGVISDDIKIDDILLPLLFLIRHYLEAALKHNLMNVNGGIYNKKLCKEHSLHELFKLLNKEVNDAIGNIDDKDFKKETIKYHNNLKQLINTIDALDKLSQAFRYPVDKNGNTFTWTIEKDFIISIYTIASKTDAYISFVISALKYYGYLQGDDH